MRCDSGFLQLLGVIACSRPRRRRPAADTDAQKLATVRQMIDAWNTRNWQQVYDLFAAGRRPAEHDAADADRRPRGDQQAHRRAGQGHLDSIELRIQHIGVADGVVFIERVDDFVYRGKHGAVPVVGVVEVEQGRVKAWREYYDRAQMIEAMGLKEDFDATRRRQ